MDIAAWRRKIDQLDARLVELLNERARYAAEVGRLKRKKNVPLHQPEREREILGRVRRLNRGPLTNHALRRLFKHVLQEIRVAVRRSLPEAKKAPASRGKPKT